LLSQAAEASAPNGAWKLRGLICNAETGGRLKIETIAIHVGYDGDPTTKAVAVPIYQTVAFEFDSAEHGAALFNLEVQGNIYTRIGNPTNAVLEKRVAALEGGVEALSVSSGMSAIHYSLVNIAEAGNNIVSLPQLYGATYTLLAHILPKQGIAGRFAVSDRPEDVEKLIDENTRAVFCESVGNPAGNVADVEGLAKVAHKHGVPLIVDNTVATPILLRPIEYGADIVVHSMTKFMGGHGTSLGGMIVDSGKFPWRDYPERFYMLNRPEPSYHGVVYTEHFGASAFVARCRTVCQRNTGATLSPFNGFLLLQGVETMALRMERHVENARKVAEFLRGHDRVAWVNYAGFPDSPLYPMAHKYLGTRFCSLLTFGVKGGFAAGTKCFNALRLFKRMVNMGDAKSLSCHPASTTHRQLTPEEQEKVGVTPEMIRLSVGIEHIDDIIADLAQALESSAV
jgi:O-acetylhomoserine (thiol)-lyase